MIKILHFSDAHIDMANYGRHDPETGLPLRVIDFLRSLDEIVDAAIEHKVDLVIFAGDAYKDRNPAPTYQREWGKRIMRLSHAGIPALLLVGNHDLSPALGRAHALNEFTTLEVPNVWVIDKPCFLGPDDLAGVQVQVIAIPWISRSGMMAHLDLPGGNAAAVNEKLETKLTELVDYWIANAQPGLPIVLSAHTSIQGAVYGGERTVMLGNDLVLSGSLVRNPKLDYVALGHIHKAQNLTKDQKLSPKDPPPVVYPGSIERVDFGEAGDKKFYVTAEVESGKSRVNWHELKGIRPFVDCSATLDSANNIMEKIVVALPAEVKIEGAIVRLVVHYPREWEAMIDEAAIREIAAGAFEFHLIKRPRFESRVRLPEDQLAGSMSALELLDVYWAANHVDTKAAQDLNEIAAQIMTEDEQRL
jgi:exonuclease SbcD